MSNKARFDAAFARLIEHGEAKITPKKFFEILAEIERDRAQTTIELEAKVVGGRLKFEPSTDLPVHENEIIVGVRRFGKRPSRKELLVGFCGTVFLSLFLMACTTVLSHEVNASRLPLFYFGCLWAILATIRSTLHAGMGIPVWFVFFLLLSFYHLKLAHSSHYTDNPQWRLRGVTVRNLSAAKQGKPLIAPPRIVPTAHTWLTGLYSVEPTAGGSDNR